MSIMIRNLLEYIVGLIKNNILQGDKNVWEHGMQDYFAMIRLVI